MKKIALLSLLFILFIGLFLVYSVQAPNSDTTKKVFVINQGENLSTIAARLKKYSFIRNRYAFMVYSYLLGQNNKIQAGTFYLTTSQSLPNLIKKLTSGGSTDYWLKVIGGQRLAELSVTFDDSLEGFIFPDSYLIPKDYQPSQIYTDIIKKNFDQKYAKAKINATNTKMSEAEIINLASLLEREARTLTSKQMVAGILLNRLEIGMALQLDTTAEYARDSKIPHPKAYWQEATAADIHIVSPYNTYLHRGLPPGPICNPGYDSIYAALHPTPSNYIYYLTGNDNLMHYAITFSEHTTNVEKYLR